MPRLSLFNTAGICPFSESPYMGQPCDCAGCNYDPKASSDCGCADEDAGCGDCDGPVQGCEPPTDECIFPASGYCGEYCQCVECKDNPDCPKTSHCAEEPGPIVTNCTEPMLSCAVAKKLDDDT